MSRDAHVIAMGYKLYRSVPLTDKEKARLRAANGIKKPFSVDRVTSDKPKKDRDFLAPTNIVNTISPRKRRGFNGCKLSPELRAIVKAKLEAREAFHAELRAAAKRGQV